MAPTDIYRQRSIARRNLLHRPTRKDIIEIGPEWKVLHRMIEHLAPDSWSYVQERSNQDAWGEDWGMAARTMYTHLRVLREKGWVRCDRPAATGIPVWTVTEPAVELITRAHEVEFDPAPVKRELGRLGWNFRRRKKESRQAWRPIGPIVVASTGEVVPDLSLLEVAR